jgi:hypothetical protein
MKKSTFPPPPAQCTALWGEGAGRCFLWCPEDLLNKNVSYSSIIIKSTLKNYIFIENL